MDLYLPMPISLPFERFSNFAERAYEDAGRGIRCEIFRGERPGIVGERHSNITGMRAVDADRMSDQLDQQAGVPITERSRAGCPDRPCSQNTNMFHDILSTLDMCSRLPVLYLKSE
tara:strand:- start:1530 stop:1877 length:348 start_codon:yes stop_codon:yes gene_type:complete